MCTSLKFPLAPMDERGVGGLVVSLLVGWIVE